MSPQAKYVVSYPDSLLFPHYIESPLMNIDQTIISHQADSTVNIVSSESRYAKQISSQPIDKPIFERVRDVDDPLCLCYWWVRLPTGIHYGDVIMSAMASQIPSISMVCSTVCSGADQRKYQSSMSSSNGNIYIVTGLLEGNSPVTGEFPSQRPVTRK